MSKATEKKARELGIDLSKTSVGSLVNKLHKTTTDLNSCRTGKPSNVSGAKNCGCDVGSTTRSTAKKVTKGAINAGKKAKKTVKDAGSGILDAICNR